MIKLKPLILLVSFFTFKGISSGQSIIQLRDLDFKVPDNFYSIDTNELKRPNYSAFCEYGLFVSDSFNIQTLPKIIFTYFEVPGFGYDNSNDVLNRLNKRNESTFNYDSIKILTDSISSIGSFTMMNNLIFEGKKLGGKGWINIFFYSSGENIEEDYQTFLSIFNSITFNEQYENIKTNLEREGSKSTVFLILALGAFLLVSFIRKFLKKESEKESLDT